MIERLASHIIPLRNFNWQRLDLASHGSVQLRIISHSADMRIVWASANNKASLAQQLSSSEVKIHTDERIGLGEAKRKQQADFTQSSLGYLNHVILIACHTANWLNSFCVTVNVPATSVCQNKWFDFILYCINKVCVLNLRWIKK